MSTLAASVAENVIFVLEFLALVVLLVAAAYFT